MSGSPQRNGPGAPMKDARSEAPLAGTLVAILIVVAIAIWTGAYISSSIERIRERLPVTVVDQLSDFDALVRSVAKLSYEADSTQAVLDVPAVLRPISEAQALVRDLRRKYELSDPLGLTRAHALADPALTDLERWLTKGVVGHGADSVVVKELVRARVLRVLEELLELERRTHDSARMLLGEESARLGRLRTSALTLIAAIATLSLGVVYFMLRNRAARRARGRASFALRRSEHRTRAVMETARDAILTCDGAGRVTFWNPAAARLFGFSFDEVHMHSCTMLTPLRHRAAYAEALEKLWERPLEHDVNVLKCMRKDGSEFPAELSLSAQSFEGERFLTIIVRDTTARRQAERELRRREEQFRDYASATADRFWEMDASLKFTFVTPLPADSTAEPHPLIGQTLWQAVGADPDSDPHWTAHRAALLAHEPFRDFRFHVAQRSGGVEHWQISGVPVVSEKGVFLGYRGAVANITREVGAAQAAERALLSGERRYRELIEGAVEGIVIDRQGRPLFANQSFADMFGFDHPEQVLALESVDAVYAADERARMAELRDAQLHGDERPSHYEFRSTDTRGRERWLENRTRIVEWAGEPAIQSTIVDITERKHAALAVEEGEALIRLIADSVPALVAYVTPEMGLRFANKRYDEWLAESKERSGANPIQAIAGGGNGSTLEGEFHAAMRGTATRCPFTRLFPDGQRRDTDVFFVPDRGRDDKVRGVIMFVNDVTHQKTIEASLRLAKETADSANRSKSEFLSAMSHDLRTPLNSILGFGELLHLDAEPALSDEERNEAIEQILKAGEHLLELIDEVLDLARIEGGGLRLSMQAVDVASVVRECLQLIQPLTTPRAIHVHVGRLPKRSKHIRADDTRFRQVLLNLLSNAVKYNNAGGHIEVSFSHQPDERLRISVSDTGPGIPRARQHELFEPFSRFAAERRGASGTGIGLAITKRLTEVMGGDIGVQSDAGEGATFWVEFALAHAALPADDTNKVRDRRAPASRGDARHAVLYIEDSTDNVLLVRRWLQRRPDYTLVEAPDAEIGLEIAMSDPPDVILLDINLPGADGFEALQRLQNDHRTKHIPVIAFSADAQPHQIERGLKAGFCKYITKPAKFAELIGELDDAVYGERPRPLYLASKRSNKGA